MSWRGNLLALLFLAFHSIVGCRAEMVRWCDGAIWSEPQAVFVGQSFEVFCRCNSTKVRPQDMYLQPSHLTQKWNTTPVDEYTIKHRVEVNYARQYFRTLCMFEEEVLGELYVKVVPLLHVVDFQCRKHSTENEANCIFKELGFAASIPKKSYSLSVNGLPSIPCWKLGDASSWIECRGLYIPKGSGLEKQIQLSMEYEGYNQTQVFPMSLRQMTVPEWPLTQPQFIQSSSRVCLKWAHTDRSSPMALSQHWRVYIIPKSPKIEPMYKEMFVFPMFFQILCFPKMPYANQVYTFRFKRRYNVTDAPWSTPYNSQEFTSIGVLPDRPPELLPNGFYHDPEKQELYVFWQQLDELELNGPNFTYAAITGTGKSASSIDSNCALFRDWDSTLPAVIYVWSLNSLGPSTNRTQLEVPLLTNSRAHQPLEVRYHDDNYTLSWEAPQEQQGLDGYVISWCSGSTNRSQICNDHESIHLQMVDGSKLHFPFNQSMVLSNLAVAGTYKDKPSGGMRWIGPKFRSAHREEQKTRGLGLGQVIAVIIVVLSLVGLIFASLRKMRKMAKIEVSLPEILFKPVDIEISVPGPAVSIAVPGNFSPNGVLTIDILTREHPVEEEALDLDHISESQTSTSESPSSSREELAYEAQSETPSRPSPYVTLPQPEIQSRSTPYVTLGQPEIQSRPSPYVTLPQPRTQQRPSPYVTLPQPEIQSRPTPYVTLPQPEIQSRSTPHVTLAQPGIQSSPSPYLTLPPGYVKSPF